MQATRRSFLKNGSVGASLLAMSTACSREDQATANDLGTLDAVETAARIRAGEVSAEEVTKAAIGRAKKVEPQINAIAAKTYKSAVKDAAAATGPWGGVPTFVKDLFEVNGVRTAFGSRAFPGYKGKSQNPVIDALLGLGVVSLGKSTTPEFGLTATTEPFSTGPTRNPWNTDYSSGGSSGGAAALVAARVVPMAHATDGGGSIRIPASCCGNVGLKPSRNRNPEGRAEPRGLSISVHGVQSRTVRDTAAFSHAMEVPAEISGLAPIGLVTGPSEKRLRIGLVDTSANNHPLDGEVISAARDAATLCEGLGHEIVPFKIPVTTQLEDDFLLLWAANAYDAVKYWEQATKLKRNGFAFEPFTLGLVEHFEANSGKFDGALARLLEVIPAYQKLFESVDVILSPVLGAPPVEIGYLKGDLDYDLLISRLLDYAQFTALYNISGGPAISLPLAMSKSGLPIGVMFGADIGEEKTLLELSYELEAAAPWAGRIPRVVA